MTYIEMGRAKGKGTKVINPTETDMSILDSVLDATTTRVLSSNHDLGDINFVNGLSDPYK